MFCANNVFAHIDDMSDVVKGIRLLLADDGAFVFEVSYIVDMIDNMVFDTIYHEHVSHHALIPLETFLNRHDMTLFHVARTGTKGGSIRAFAQPKSTGKRPRSAELSALIAEEERRGITTPRIYRDWFEAIESRKRKVLTFSTARSPRARRSPPMARPRPRRPCSITSSWKADQLHRRRQSAQAGALQPGRTYSCAAVKRARHQKAGHRRDPGLDLCRADPQAQPGLLSAGGQFLVPLPEPRVVDRKGTTAL